MAVAIQSNANALAKCNHTWSTGMSQNSHRSLTVTRAGRCTVSEQFAHELLIEVTMPDPKK